ncbi:MAG TPA: DoxX family protein [Acidimicrobiales bacterium]|nr:DoxX family protein [Acidimicrobiales bacterium]
MDALPTVDQLNFGLLLLRVVVGPVFAFHGYAKVFRGGRLDGTARWFDSMGMRPGHLHARAAAFGELATGTCLALGLLTPFAGMGLVGLMSVAFWTVHKGNGLLVTKDGWEYNLVLAAIGVALATIGAGEWSLDGALGLDLNGPAGCAIAVVGGLGLAAGLLATCYRPPAPAPATEPETTA